MLKVVHHKVQQVLKDQQEVKEPKVHKEDKGHKVEQVLQEPKAI